MIRGDSRSPQPPRAGRAARPEGRETLRQALLRDRLPDEYGAGLDRRPRDPYAGYDPGARVGLTVVLVLLEAAVVALALLLASAWLATRPAVALPAHARGLATLAEVDALVALRAPDLQRQLDAGSDALTLADFPVHDLAIDRSEAESADGTLDATAFRDALLAASALEVYERGIEALRVPDATVTTSDRLVEGFFGALTSQRHQQAGLALLAALGAVAVLKVLLLFAARGSRWLALDVAMALGGALALAATFVARGALATLDTTSSDALAEYAAITRTLLNLPMWNALIALGLGVALALPPVLGRRRG